MAADITVTAGLGELGQIESWDIDDDINSTIIGSGSSNVGSLNLTAKTVTTSKYLDGNTLSFSDDEAGSLTATVDGVTPGPVETTLTAFGLMGQLNVEKTAPAIYGTSTLSDAYSTYIALCFATPPPISFTAASNPVVTYPGWSGNVWEALNNLGATTRTELAVIDGVIVIRDINTLTLSTVNATAPGVLPNVDSSDIALTVKIEAQNATSVDSVGANIYNYAVNPSLETNATNWSNDLVLVEILPETDPPTFSTEGTATTTPVRSTTTAYSGTAGYRGVYTATGLVNPVPGHTGYRYCAAQAYYKLSNNVVPGDLDAFYASSYFYYTNTLGSSWEVDYIQAYVWVVWYNAESGGNPVEFSYGTPTSITASTWTRLLASGTAPASALRGELYVQFNARWKKSAALSVGTYPTITPVADAATISGSNIAYFDGNSAGGSWTGTANNSSSLKANPSNTSFYDAFLDNNTIYTIDVNEKSTTIVQIDSDPTILSSALQSSSTSILPGQYYVSDSTGVGVSTVNWPAYGGEVSWRLTGNPKEIEITLQGPSVTIPGTTAPYSMSYTAAGVETATLSIAAAGVYCTPEVVTLQTGADTNRTQQEVGADLTGSNAIPFLQTTGEARDRGSELAGYYGGPRVSIEFSLGAAYVDGIGYVSGSLVTLDDNIYRVISTHLDANEVRVTAVSRVMGSDFDSIWSGATGATFDLTWAGGYTGNEFAVNPLWR